jgi:hypothetical protein
MIWDLPPKIWLPSKPAIIRPAPVQKANFLPGMFPGMLMVGASAATPMLAHTGSDDDSADQSSYSFLNVPFGTEAASRYMVVAVGARINSGTVNPTAVTIAGNSASVIIQQSNGDNYVGLWGVALPTGTTGTVQVDFDDLRDQCLISVYALYDLSSTTPNDTSDDINTALSLDINTLADGVLIAAGFSNTTPTAFEWTGATEDYEQVSDAGGLSTASASALAAATPRTLSCSVTGGNEDVGVAAAWR